MNSNRQNSARKTLIINWDYKERELGIFDIKKGNNIIYISDNTTTLVGGRKLVQKELVYRLRNKIMNMKPGIGNMD